MVKKVDLRDLAGRMVKHLGGREVDSQSPDPQFVIDTIAGEMRVHPFEDWVACRFLDVERAKAISPPGSLNPFSGKWNWHGISGKPSQEGLREFFDHLCQVVPAKSSVNEWVNAYHLALQVSGPGTGDEVNVKLSYAYRHTSNHMVNEEVILSGAPRSAYVLQRVLMGLDLAASRPRLFLHQVGLVDLQNLDGGEHWDPDHDEPWHEVIGVEMSWRTADSKFEDFAHRVFQSAFVDGWDESNRPDLPERARQ